jgi:hypothetical protein
MGAIKNGISEEENSQFCWAKGPDARAGIYYFGFSKEQGHEQTQSYGGQLVRDLQSWCGNITKTVDACFAGIDRKFRDEYREKFASLSQVEDRRAAETFEELFAFLPHSFTKRLN